MYIKLISILKKYKYFLLYAGLTPVLCTALVLAVRKFPYLGQLYSTYIFPLFPTTLGRFFSIFPFSFLEISIYGLTLGAICILLLILSSLFSKNSRQKLLLHIPKIIVFTLCFCSTIVLMVTLSCSINYSRDGISKDIGMTVAPSSHDDLVNLCLLLIGDITNTVRLNEFSDEMNTVTLQNQTKQAMVTLGKEYPSLQGYYPNPKPVVMSSWMSDINLTGLFSPYTIEANYNNDVVNYVKPYTICHELAHLRGYIREDDAGFIAYLACSNSQSAELRYSGAMNALGFALSALYNDSTEEEYKRILAKVPKEALSDLIENQTYWQNHQGTASRISTAANDTYLKANAQAGGVKSYGRMVDLLLSYYGLNNQLV
ncbi:MAG: DUF3810 domain-containing protein [Aminipila sp.]